ncbi:MAG: hypothetical protein II483_06590 [Lachnospiraceae bacterium]|nr:hypothetical protein [Lachnospiraceae bacterium]
MKRKYLVWCAVLLFAVSISVALADTGPKPAVSVYVKNLGGATCYATLLSEREQYGPYCTTEIEKRWDEMRAETAVWEAFAAYKDPDGFFFLQELWDLRYVPKYAWEYHPPRIFKVLLYWPDEGRFAVSEITEAKDFYSLFEVDASEVRFADGSNIGTIAVKPVDSYSYRIWAFASRVLITLAVELLIALAFLFRTKREWLVIIATNILTQIALGIFATISVVRGGRDMQFFVTLAFLELGVAIIEAVVYILFLRKASGMKRGLWVYVVYALVANAASYFVGLWIDGRLVESLKMLLFMD